VTHLSHMYALVECKLSCCGRVGRLTRSEHVEEYYRIDSNFVIWDTRIQRIMGRGGRNVLRSSTFLFLNFDGPNLVRL